MKPYSFTSRDDNQMDVRKSVDPGYPCAVIDTDPLGPGPVVEVPPHKVPALARALYEAAGLPVPDLPDIPDPGLVQALASDLCEVATDLAFTDDHADAASNRAYIATGLLARGWGRTA